MHPCSPSLSVRLAAPTHTHPIPTTHQIIGSTGPVLAFTLVLYRTAQSLGLSFLPLYSWVGIWTSLILLLSSVTSFSNLVNYFTRFTDEIFSLLISAIFLFEGPWTSMLALSICDWCIH